MYAYDESLRGMTDPLGSSGKHEALGRLPAGDLSIPAPHVQARRSMIFADAAAVHGEQSFQGAIFDVDGVLVDSPHFRAWRDALRELMDTEWAELRGRTSYSPDKFTEAVYQEVVAGRPRLSLRKSRRALSSSPSWIRMARTSR